jgi:hypothetical protein
LRREGESVDTGEEDGEEKAVERDDGRDDERTWSKSRKYVRESFEGSTDVEGFVAESDTRETKIRHRVAILIWDD